MPKRNKTRGPKGANSLHDQIRAAIRKQLGPPVKYDPKIVAFLDILGFRNLLKDEEKLYDLASRVRMLNDIFAADQAYKSNGSVLQISDGIIISSEIADLSDLDSFLREIMLGVEALLYLGIPVRGAITYGPHYHRESVLVSPAFAAAYEMERDVAKYPRVVIDLSVIERQRDLMTSDTDISALPLNKYTKVDQDGYRFVHFMKAPLDEQYDLRRDSQLPLVNKEILIEWSLRMIRRTIEEGFEKNTLNSVRAKYVWLANYYNESIKTDLGLDKAAQQLHQIECKYLELPDPANPNFKKQ